MEEDKNRKKLPQGISYRKKDNRYMGRFMYHGERFTVYGKTLKETKKNLADLKYEVEHKIFFKDSSVTFDAWFEIWIRDYKEPSVKGGTVNVYRQNYNAYIHACFGNKQLSDIRTDHIQRYYNGMAKHYSHNTLEICRAILNGMYNQAVRNGLIQKNPVSGAVLPRNNKRKTANVMTEAEQKVFLSYAQETEYYPIYELALFTGMRSGELRGLQWKDIDFEKRTIHVRHTLVYLKGKELLDSPKTFSSERDIPMLDNVYHLLKEQRKNQVKQRLAMGKQWTPPEGLDNLVFTNFKGHPINRDRFKRAIDKIIYQIQKHYPNFPHITPHTFRHTFATRSIERNIPPKVLQTILGHSELSTTMDTYAHVLPDTKVNEMQKLTALFV